VLQAQRFQHVQSLFAVAMCSCYLQLLFSVAMRRRYVPLL